MLRLLQSSWAAALLGVLAYCATTYLCWKTPNGPESSGGKSETANSPKGPSWNYSNPEVEQLVLDLTKEKEALALREQQLNELATRLQNERLELGQVTQTINRLQIDFDRNVVRIREEESANLKKLAKVYAAMTPDGAITILKELGDEQVVKIMAFMKETETAPLLELLAKQGDAEAKRAALISERLRLTLHRNTAAPKNS
jgi:flagellar motility protein MotE (MotC chaperone)